MTIGSDTRGVFAIAPTPFQPDGALDRPSLDRMVDFYEAAGVDGLTILGIMGEAPKLDAAEALEIVGRIVKRTRLPVVVGVSAPGFAAMRGLARAAMDLGAAAVMIAPIRTSGSAPSWSRKSPRRPTTSPVTARRPPRCWRGRWSVRASATWPPGPTR